MKNLVIKNATLYDCHGSQKADIEIQEGKITKIQPSIPCQDFYDGTSLTLIPACIDLNIQSKDFTQEGLKALEKKAIQGGVGNIALQVDGSMIDFLNFYNTQSPITFLSSAIPYYNHQIQEVSKLYGHQASSLALNTDMLNQALKCIFEYAKMLSLPCLCSYKNNPQEIASPSELSYKMGLSSYLSFIQDVEFSRFMQFAEHFEVFTLLQAVNENNLLQKIQDFQYVLSEVSIHHLLLDEEKIKNYNTWAKLTPPLCTQATQQELLKSLANIDMLTSLHREFSFASKEQTFEDAKSGVDCLEFYFPLLYTELVKTHYLTLEELLQKTSFNQAQLLHLEEGEIKVGKNANLLLVDLNKSFKISHPLYGEKILFGQIKGFISQKTGMQEF